MTIQKERMTMQLVAALAIMSILFPTLSSSAILPDEFNNACKLVTSTWNDAPLDFETEISCGAMTQFLASGHMGAIEDLMCNYKEGDAYTFNDCPEHLMSFKGADAYGEDAFFGGTIAENCEIYSSTGDLNGDLNEMHVEICGPPLTDEFRDACESVINSWDAAPLDLETEFSCEEITNFLASGHIQAMEDLMCNYHEAGGLTFNNCPGLLMSIDGEHSFALRSDNDDEPWFAAGQHCEDWSNNLGPYLRSLPDDVCVTDELTIEEMKIEIARLKKEIHDLPQPKKKQSDCQKKNRLENRFEITDLKCRIKMIQKPNKKSCPRREKRKQKLQKRIAKLDC